MITQLRTFRDCTSGTALVEMTIVVPVLLLLMVGIIEVGRAIQDYETADKSMRSAARYLARLPEALICTYGYDNARELAVYGTISPSDGTPPLIAGWDPATVTFSRSPVCGTLPPEGGNLVLRIHADVPIPVPMLGAISLPTTVNIRVDHEERHIGS